MGRDGKEEQTGNYRKVTHGVIMCSMATIANNTIYFYFVHLNVPKRVMCECVCVIHTKVVGM